MLDSRNGLLPLIKSWHRRGGSLADDVHIWTDKYR